MPGPNASDDRADVTVVIPAYNRAHVLPRALASVHSQSLQPAAIIVVDDGSSDETAAVARQFGATVLRHERSRGAGEARNTGIASARTRWIAFLDSDDEWAPHHLATLIPQMGRHALLTSVLVDTFGRARGNTTGQGRPISPDMLFFPENVICTSTVVADRSALIDAGLFRTMDRAEDLDLWVRLLRCGTGYALTVPTGTYHVGETYVAQGLHRRNRVGTTAVLQRYEHEQWMTRRLRWNVQSQGHWDDFRHAWHRRDRRAAMASLGRLLRTPTGLTSVAATFQHRRRGRSATWRRLSVTGARRDLVPPADQ